MSHSPDAEGGPRPPPKDPLPPEILALVVQGCRGDRQALERLIGCYQGRVARFVIGQTGGDAPYEDLCQTIFLKMVLALPRLRTPERFEPWLFRIARNACRDHLRRRRGWHRLFVPFEPGHLSIPARVPEPRDDAETRVQRGIEQLPERQRSLLRLWLERKRSYEELADLTSSSIPAVRSRLHRARDTLRAILLREDAE